MYLIWYTRSIFFYVLLFCSCVFLWLLFLDSWTFSTGISFRLAVLLGRVLLWGAYSVVKQMYEPQRTLLKLRCPSVCMREITWDPLNMLWCVLRSSLKVVNDIVFHLHQTFLLTSLHEDYELFFTHRDRNSLNIYRSEKCCGRKLLKRTQQTSFDMPFFASTAVSETLFNKTGNVRTA